VVFDVRGYPRDRRIVSHLTEDTILGFHGLVPWSVYPDRKRIVAWDDRFRWVLPPRTPRIRGEVVFLTNAAAISFAESVLSMVEADSLGQIVGQATAGANGTVNPFDLPGGFLLAWTGLKVLKPDGRQLHRVGIQPTVMVDRSIAAVRGGKDEYLEKALQLIRAANPRKR
jgi:C-terminal processing protease CtpA/Prc